MSSSRHQDTSVSFLKTTCCFLYHLDDRPPSMFQLNLGVYIFYYTRSKLIARQIPVPNRPEKSNISSARYISVAMPYIL